MSSAAGTGPTKVGAKIALLGVDGATSAVLTECFRQFGMEAVAVPAHESGSVGDTYNACVVPLDAEAETVLRDIRKGSHWLVVYGICGSVSEALRFSKFGINAVFHTPVSKQEALQVVRGTHLLVMKELRRYVRVPLVCPVTLEAGTEVLEGSSLEISAGGMALTINGPAGAPKAVLATFTLPGYEVLAVQSVFCWIRHDEGTAAIRFDPFDPGRLEVGRWIDEYLGA